MEQPVLASREPAFRRLAALASLPPEDQNALQIAMLSHRSLRPHREIVAEGQFNAAPVILLTGWAARIRILPDGRRQILSLLLPGDLIGMGSHARPVAPATVVSITPVTLCTAPPSKPRDDGTGLAEAYAVSAALEQFYLLRHVARLGRMSAYERIADFLLEVLDRLTLAGLVTGSSFPFPLTQEALADALGLTSVHVNRMVQALRKDQVVDMRSGTASLRDPASLADMVDFRPAHVTRQLK